MRTAVTPFSMNLYAGKNGYWRCIYRDHLGRKRERGMGAIDKVTKSEALHKMRTLALEFAQDPLMSAITGRATVHQWCERFKAANADLRESSQLMLAKACELLIEKFGRDTDISRITEADAADFRNWLKARKRGERSISLATVAKHLRYAKAIFARAVVERSTTGLVANPFRHESGTAPASSKQWAKVGEADLDKILAACPSIQYRRLFALCRWAGLRLMEARRLQWVDVAADRLTVRGAPRHDGRVHNDTKHKTRTVPLDPRLATLLQERSGSGPCDGIPSNPHRLNTLGERFVRQSGVPPYPATFHTLRANREDEWLAQFPVLVVAAWMGHSPRVAQQHYTRPTEEQFAAGAGGYDREARIKALEAEIARLKSAGN